MGFCSQEKEQHTQKISLYFLFQNESTNTFVWATLNRSLVVKVCNGDILSPYQWGERESRLSTRLEYELFIRKYTPKITETCEPVEWNGHYFLFSRRGGDSKYSEIYSILFLGIIVMGHCGMTGALDWHNMHIIIIVHNNFITGD